MTGFKFLDSSVWVHYLVNDQYRELIENSEFSYISTLSLFEIKRKLLKDKFDENKLTKALGFIERKTLIISPSKEITLLAAELSVKHKLGAMDALIYTTAQQHGAELITCDNDFRGLENVQILPLK